MCPRAGWPLRGGVALLVGAVVATSCARTEGPTLTAGGPPEAPEALALIADTATTEAVPTPHPPALLGLDGPTVAEPATPPPVRIPDRVHIGPAPDGDGFSITAVAGAPGEPDESVDTTSAVAADEVDRPPPPPAAAGSPPLYPNPSEMIVAASGRPVALFDDDELDATERGVTSRGITVAGLVSQTLVGNPYREAVCVGARARFAQANEHRDLGRRIDLIDCYDDAGQADLSEGLAGTVLRDGAFAVVPLASPAFAAERRLHRERAIYVGDDRLPGFCGRENLLGFGTRGAQGCPVLDARGYVSLVVPVLTAYLASRSDRATAIDLTYVVTDSAEGASIAASRAFEAELLEAPQPTFLAVLPTIADPSPRSWREVVDQILATTPEVVVLDGPRTEGLPAALREQGFRGELVLVGLVDPLVVADAERRVALAPMTVVSPGLDLANRSSAGWAALEGAAAAVGLAPHDVGLDFVQGYLAADFFVRAVAATPEPLTVERMADTVNRGWWYPGIEGLACGTWWPAAHLIPSPCVSVSHVEVFTPRMVPVLDLVEIEPQIRFDLGG